MQDPHVGARAVTGKVALNRTMGGGYQQPTYAPGASYAPKISMGRPGTAAPVMRGGSQNFSIKAAANGDYINNFGSGDIVCNREFFTMTEDRPIVKEVSCLSFLSVPVAFCWFKLEFWGSICVELQGTTAWMVGNAQCVCCIAGDLYHVCTLYVHNCPKQAYPGPGCRPHAQ